VHTPSTPSHQPSTFEHTVGPTGGLTALSPTGRCLFTDRQDARRDRRHVRSGAGAANAQEAPTAREEVARDEEERQGPLLDEFVPDGVDKAMEEDLELLDMD